jgi:hypothetical protein
MTTTKHEWWATPVWEIETGFDSTFNNELLVEIEKCKPPTNPYMFNIWDYSTPNITILKQKILSAAKENVSPYFEKFYKFNPILSRGWVNRQHPGNSLALHNHGDAMMACTYYIKTTNDCGDLQLVDPRGGANWDLAREGNVLGIKYKRIKPTEGKLVMFPAFLVHMVELNKSTSTRISLATNIYSNGS